MHHKLPLWFNTQVFFIYYICNRLFKKSNNVGFNESLPEKIKYLRHKYR